MEKLFKKLENNTSVLERLNHRHEFAKVNPFYSLINNGEQEKNKDLDWVIKIKKRVLKMRYTLLENIQGEITKEMQAASNKMRKLIVQKIKTT